MNKHFTLNVDIIQHFLTNVLIIKINYKYFSLFRHFPRQQCPESNASHLNQDL